MCGSRTWEDRFAVWSVLDGLLARSEGLVVVHGANPRGGDSLAKEWAESRGVEADPYPARWQEHADGWCPGEWCRQRSYCVAAGPRRNQQMLDEGQPGVVFAFRSEGKSNGTDDMVERARAAGVKAYVIRG